MEIDVTYEQICEWDKSEYLWVDIRDEISAMYGGIPESVWISEKDLPERITDLPVNKKIVLYCMRGIVSIECAKALREKGIEANIFKSVENANLSTVIAYKKDGERHHFLDEYMQY